MKRRSSDDRPTRDTGGRFGPVRLLVLIALLVAPGLALWRLFAPTELWKPLVFLAAINLATYVVYAADKRRARAQEWRVSEAKLQSLAFIGGWPAAFVAQYRLRHKCAKMSFQIVFWLVVLVHQFVAIDSLNEWRMSEKASDLIREHRP
jgi:uncharacterized membrane protein YsdA (DUF1294 family)